MCASYHLCNNRKLFRSTHAKSIDFVTAAGQVIQTNEINTIAIPLSDGKTIELHNITYASECDLNLISLDQLRKRGILFHDDPITMTLMREEKIIAHVKREQNLFVFKLAAARAAMAIRSLKPRKAMANSLTQSKQLYQGMASKISIYQQCSSR